MKLIRTSICNTNRIIAVVNDLFDNVFRIYNSNVIKNIGRMIAWILLNEDKYPKINTRANISMFLVFKKEIKLNELSKKKNVKNKSLR
jgi:hypothetical protein